MGESEYAVAYLDEDGIGFSETEPWITDCISLHRCKEDVKELLEEGFKKVIPFKYGRRMDYYDWDYVNQHKIIFE